MMNASTPKILLVNVFRTEDDQDFEEFVYSINGPVNLHVSALCDDGSRMGPEMMAYGLTELFKAGKTDLDDFLEVATAANTVLRFKVCELVPKEDVSAFQAMSASVRRVHVDIIRRSVD